MAPGLTTVATRVTFLPPGPFHADVKARVEAYFRTTGRSPRGGWRLGLKGAVLGAWFLASYLLLLLGPGWAAAPLAVSLGLAWAGIGFDVMHDANHGASARRPAWNRLLAFSSDLIGGSSAVWRHKHNVLHHSYTNVVGVDADLDAGALLRLAPGQRRRVGHRWQHLYVWILYLVFPLRWFLFDDLRDLATGRVGAQPFPRPRGGELAALFLGKALFLAWAVVVPLLVRPTWWLLPVALLAVGTLGVTLATVFQLAHVVGEADSVAPDLSPEAGPQALALQVDWATHQVLTTVDFARGSRLLGWYLGGLNFQVVHHLFPRVSHVHYRALAPMVEAACRVHGVRYRAWPGLGAAVAANVRWLARLGRAEGAPGGVRRAPAGQPIGPGPRLPPPMGVTSALPIPTPGRDRAANQPSAYTRRNEIIL